MKTISLNWVAVAYTSFLNFAFYFAVQAQPNAEKITGIQGPATFATIQSDTLQPEALQKILTTRDSLLIFLNPVDTTLAKVFSRTVEDLYLSGVANIDSLTRNFSSRIDTSKRKLGDGLSMVAYSERFRNDSLNQLFDTLSIGNVAGFNGLPDVQQLIGDTNNGFFNLPSIQARVSTDKMSESVTPQYDSPLSSFDDVEDIQELEVPAISQFEESINATEEMSRITSIAESSQDHISKLAAVDTIQIDKLPEQFESHIAELEVVKEVQAPLDEVDKAKRFHDPQMARSEMISKAKTEAVNHFAGHEQELKEAIEKLAEVKTKIPNPDGVIDAFAKTQRPYKNIRLIERLLPGLTLQIQESESFWLDLNPQMGFKIASRWQAGLGWNERLAYSFNSEAWDSDARIFGTRSFVHFQVKKGFWVKSDVEYMNSSSRNSYLKSSEITSRNWYWNFFVGIKKDFQFSKRLLGNIQTIYAFDKHLLSDPYAQRFNVRMGFELLPKKADRAFK